MALPTFGAAGTALAAGSGTSASVAVPSGVLANDVILVDLYLEGLRTVTAPAGFTLIGGAPVATSKQWHYRYWKRATAADSGSYVFTWTTSIYRRAVAHRYRGVITTGTPHDSGAGAPVGAARSSAGTVTPAVSLTTQGIDRLLVWSGTNWSGGTWTPPSGYTERVDSAEITVATRDQAAAGSTGSVTGTSTASDHETASLIALLPASTTQTVTSAGIASAETFGSGTITTGAVTVTSPSIDSTETFGVGRMQTAISSLGIPSEELVSPDSVIDIPGFISSLGIPSAEAFGTSFVQLKNITPLGIPSAEAFGSGLVLAGAVSLTSTGIPSAEAHGSHQINLTIYTVGIASAQAFGLGMMVAGPVSVTSTGIESAEAFGVHRVLVTIDTTTRGLTARLRTTPIYELLVMARLPQKVGAPTFLLVDPIEWSTLNWTSTVSKPQALTAKCRIDSITEPVKQQLRNPDRLPTELWLQRNGKTVFAGPLLGGMEEEDEVSLEAGGLLTYLQGMFVLTDLTYKNTDQFLITTDLINRWQATEYGHFGIDTTGVVACGKVRDAVYERNEMHKLDIRIDELGKRTEGFDYEVDPSTRALKLWYPGKGVDRSTGEDAVVFDGRSIDGRGGMFSLAPGDLASVAFGSATPTGAEKSIWSEKVNEDLLIKYGRIATSGSWADIPNQATLDDQVQGLLDARDQVLRVPGSRVRVTADTDLDTYDVGDTISYELSGLLGISGAYRIRSRAVAVSETGEEDVTLEFA